MAQAFGQNGPWHRLLNVGGWMLLVLLATLGILYGVSYAAILTTNPLAAPDTRAQMTADYAPWPYLVFQPVSPAMVEEIRRDQAQDTPMPDTLVVLGFVWNNVPTPVVTGTAQLPTLTPTATSPAVSTAPPPTGTSIAPATGTKARTPTPPPTFTRAPTRTPWPTWTPIPTVTHLPTVTPVPPTATSVPPAPTNMPTLTPTSSVPTNTPTMTLTPTAPTNTPTATTTSTPTDTSTATATPSDTPTSTSTPTDTQTPTSTPTPTPSNTPTSTNTPTATWTPIPGVNVGAPNGSYASVACGGSVIVDLASTPIQVPGSDLVYYEHNTGLGILLDHVIVDVCLDAGCTTRYTVFYWGDSISTNNGDIQAYHYPPIAAGEAANESIPGGELYGPLQSGIVIDVDIMGVPAGTYQYVRITSPAAGCGFGNEAEVDALQVLP